MKRILIICLLFPTIFFAQYWGERTTEQSFEQSDLFFKSHFLNTFGVKYFKDISVGMIDDPFLNLQLNPANTPDLGNKEIYVYLDFRGDRTEEAIIENYAAPVYDALSSYAPPIDRRWHSETRTEPEPLVSLGMLTYPIESLSKKFYVGGTYQLLLKEESFYSMPIGIYNSQYYYDSFGREAHVKDSYHITDHHMGSDEMINEGHLYSAFAGYNFNDDLKIGLSINGVAHSRQGNHSNSFRSEYYNIEDQWSNSDFTQRNQDYSHLDINTGIIYNLTSNFSSGIKFGVLSGNIDQNYIQEYSYFSQQNTPEESPEWNLHASNSSTVQNWNHDGNTYYFRVHFTRKLKGDNEASGFYRYGYSDINTSNHSVIDDTTYYSNRWNNETHYGSSSVLDIRNGLGYRNRSAHEAMLNFKWLLSEKSMLTAGVYFNSNKTKIFTSEPVTVNRYSSYDQDNIQRLYEDKELSWEHESSEWSLQIPILFNFEFNEYFSMMIGLNRIFESWNITDVTTALFNERVRTENGEETKHTNFGERYFQPDRGITEDHTDIVTRFSAKPSDALKISLLLDPQFENSFRIAQWWLSFEA
ncbi:MAG: hypothetical protein ABFS12_18525, partial [Bacteroidota bacterium]